MGYISALKLILSDLKAYQREHNGNKLKKTIRVLFFERGFIYSFWLRLAHVNSILLPLVYIPYRFFSALYNIQIPRRLTIGPSFVLCHGTCVVINGSAKISRGVQICHFVTIGNNSGVAPLIEDNVYIAPAAQIIGDHYCPDKIRNM